MPDKMPTKADARKVLASLPITLKAYYWIKAIMTGLKTHPLVSTGLIALFILNLLFVQAIAFKVVGLLGTFFYSRSLLKPTYLSAIAQDVAELSEDK